MPLGTGANTISIWITWSAATTNTNATTDTWPIWTNVATTSGAVNCTWEMWNGNVLVNQAGAVRQLTPEEIERRDREAAERAQALREARERARDLLVAVLSEGQREDFERDGYFHVETRDGQRVYRIRPGSLPVRVRGEDGAQWSYCIHPRESYPAEDTAAALKLLLETDEDAFLRTANASRTAVAA